MLLWVRPLGWQRVQTAFAVERNSNKVVAKSGALCRLTERRAKVVITSLSEQRGLSTPSSLLVLPNASVFGVQMISVHPQHHQSLFYRI